jgi:hypothetical protein
MADEVPLPEPTDQQLLSEALAPPAPPQGGVPAEAQATTPPPAPPPEASPSPPPGVPVEAPIPSWRLREEAEARRVAEDRARTLEGRLNEIAAHLRQQQKPPDFFENPQQATQDLILQAIRPYAEETRKSMMAMGRMVASTVHGADKVDAAERAFLEARNTETLDPVDYERVVQSPNRYDAVVQWHKRQTVLSSVGDDPAAWFEKQLETRLADPKFQASLLEKVRGSAASRPSETRLPPSLSRSTAAASNGSGDIGDLSNQSLFAHATKDMAR